MGIIELVLIAVGLSMDAFAVSVCKGLGMSKLTAKDTVLIAVFFGGFQGLMPFIGWFLGNRFQTYITSFDHFVAFALLVLIGGRMVFDALKKDEETCDNCQALSIKELFVLAIATSIDALAVGITFAFFPETNIWFCVILIGVITFALSCVGVAIGFKFGSKFEKKAELCGGIILILIGTKILAEHMGWIG